MSEHESLFCYLGRRRRAKANPPAETLANRLGRLGISGEEQRLRMLDVGPEIDGDNDRAIVALRAEMRRQDHKHGRFRGTRLGRSRLALACLHDEVDEAEQAWREERKAEAWTETRTEVLQVAAVAMRALRDAFDD